MQKNNQSDTQNTMHRSFILLFSWLTPSLANNIGLVKVPQVGSIAIPFFSLFLVWHQCYTSDFRVQVMKQDFLLEISFLCCSSGTNKQFTQTLKVIDTALLIYQWSTMTSKNAGQNPTNKMYFAEVIFFYHFIVTVTAVQHSLLS